MMKHSINSDTYFLVNVINLQVWFSFLSSKITFPSIQQTAAFHRGRSYRHVKCEEKAKTYTKSFHAADGEEFFVLSEY